MSVANLTELVDILFQIGDRNQTKPAVKIWLVAEIEQDLRCHWILQRLLLS